jgi:hypothetical protein
VIPGTSSLPLTGTRKRFPRIRVTIPWRTVRLSTWYNYAMSRKARAVDNDVIEAVQEDELATLIAQAREEGAVDEELERLAFE